VGWLIGILVAQVGFHGPFWWYLFFTVLVNLAYIVWSIIALVHAHKGRLYYMPVIGRLCFDRYYGAHAARRREKPRWVNKPPEGY